MTARGCAPGRSRRHRPRRAASQRPRLSVQSDAQCVARAAGDRRTAGLLTDGDRIAPAVVRSRASGQPFRDSARPAHGWRAQNLAPDSYRLLLALAAPPGIAALPDVLDAARLSQARVTKDLRVQARAAVEGFLQAVLDDPANADRLRRTSHQRRLARAVAGRTGPGLSPAVHPETGKRRRSRARVQLRIHRAVAPRAVAQPALGPLVRRHLDQGHDTGRMLADGLRTVFRVFRDGLSCSELAITPLGGALFGAQSTPLLDRLALERARGRRYCSIACYGPRRRAASASASNTARWMSRTSAGSMRRCWNWSRASRPQPMMRLRRAKLEVVVPAAQAVTLVADAGFGRRRTPDGQWFASRTFRRAASICASARSQGDRFVLHAA